MSEPAMSERAVTRASGRMASGVGRGTVLTVLGTAVACWSVLVVADLAGAGGSFSHHALARSDGSVRPAAVSLVLLGWLLMVLAMMLPPALPLLLMVRRLVGRHPRPGLLVGVAAAAFVAVWMAAGVLLVAGDQLVHVLAGRSADRLPAGTISGVVLVGAGLYQLSRWQQSCLRACRSPQGFAVAHWHGRRPAWVEVTVVAGAYGTSCLGCCWALMLVGFAVGTAMLPVMVVLATVMAMQRMAPWGVALVRPAGWCCLALGLVLLLAPPAGHVLSVLT